MTTDPWPYPGDAPNVRAKRVAHAYRAKLLTVDPASCKEVDRQMIAWGQRWVSPQLLTYGLDDWLTVNEACEIAQIKPATLRIWRSRNRIEGRIKAGKWLYRARDVLALAAEPRERKPTLTVDVKLADDAVSTSGYIAKHIGKEISHGQ